ncbi:hypothetical protein AAMO2058_000739700 [Amorphochlora amoebiformis]
MAALVWPPMVLALILLVWQAQGTSAGVENSSIVVGLVGSAGSGLSSFLERGSKFHPYDVDEEIDKLLDTSRALRKHRIHREMKADLGLLHGGSSQRSLEPASLSVTDPPRFHEIRASPSGPEKIPIEGIAIAPMEGSMPPNEVVEHKKDTGRLMRFRGNTSQDRTGGRTVGGSRRVEHKGFKPAKVQDGDVIESAEPPERPSFFFSEDEIRRAQTDVQPKATPHLAKPEENKIDLENTTSNAHSPRLKTSGRDQGSGASLIAEEESIIQHRSEASRSEVSVSQPDEEHGDDRGDGEFEETDEDTELFQNPPRADEPPYELLRFQENIPAIPSYDITQGLNLPGMENRQTQTKSDQLKGRPAGFRFASSRAPGVGFSATPYNMPEGPQFGETPMLSRFGKGFHGGPSIQATSLEGPLMPPRTPAQQAVITSGSKVPLTGIMNPYAVDATGMPPVGGYDVASRLGIASTAE